MFHYFLRNLYFHIIETWIERSNKEHWSMSMVNFDLDHFKMINDTWGHVRGDELLRQIAELVSKIIRKTDLFARHGGEEFCIVIERCDLSGAANIAEKIRRHLS